MFKKNNDVLNQGKWCCCILFCAVISVLVSPAVFSESDETVKPPSLKRVITLAPNLTEIMFALDLGDRVVGVSDFDVWPESVEKLPRVGGYFNPNQEIIFTLKPDVVLMLEGKSGFHKKLEAADIRVHSYNCENIRSLQETIEQLGTLFGVQEKSANLNKQIQSGLASLKSEHSCNKKVMICVGMTPGTLQGIFVSGNKSLHHDLLTAIGCSNVFAHCNQSYFTANKESIIALAPDIIFDLIPGQQLNQTIKKKRLETWKLLQSVPAVKNNRIYILNNDYLNIAGPRAIHTGQLLKSHIFHGEPR